MAVDAYAGSSRCCLLLGGRDVNNFPESRSRCVECRQRERIYDPHSIIADDSSSFRFNESTTDLGTRWPLADSAHLNNTLHN